MNSLSPTLFSGNPPAAAQRLFSWGAHAARVLVSAARLKGWRGGRCKATGNLHSEGASGEPPETAREPRALPTATKPVMKFAPPPKVRLEDQGPPPSPAWSVALVLLAGALAKICLLALPLGQLADLAFDSAPNSLTPFCAWMGLLAFAMQVYALLSALHDLKAIHLRQASGLHQPTFHASYACTGVLDFWKQWLGSHKLAFPIFFLLTLVVRPGTVPLLIWIALHAAVAALEHYVLHGRALWHKLPRFFACLVTFSLILLSFVFFRSASLDHALHFYGSLFARHELTETALITDARMLSDYHLLLMIVGSIVVFALPTLQSLIEPVRAWKLTLAILALSLIGAWHLSETAHRHLRAQVIRILSHGTPDAFVGREGWLFDGRELDALTSTGALKPEITDRQTRTSKAAETVIAFAQQLKERGIPLLLIPLPMKACLYPEYITGTDPEFSEAPLYHPCQPELYERFAKAGIDVQDVTAALLQLKERRKRLFFRQDTHWTPDAMQELARAIAAHVKKKYPGVAAPDRLILDAKAPDAQDYGDLARRLNQAAPGAAYAPESTVLLTFPTLENDSQSSIVLLGGGDAQVFDNPSLGYVPDAHPRAQPMRAGFAQHLSVYLGKPLDTYSTRTDATQAPRQTFAQRLDDEVRDKQLVIWLLPARDLVLPPSAGVKWAGVQFNQARSPVPSITPVRR